MTHLGNLVKREFEKRNCGQGYDPQNEIYTPWYRILKFRVKYLKELDEKELVGHTETLHRLIKVRRSRVLETAATLYHEIQHANFVPISIISYVSVYSGTFWFAYSNSQGNYRVVVAALAATGGTAIWSQVIHSINEWYANKKEIRTFGTMD